MMNNLNLLHAPPKASAMIEALRGLGYNCGTALADIIDNSIAADATNIYVNFYWDDTKSHITILDDGNGMSKAELNHAMTLGSINPNETRKYNDLGRFGLGLKTASFSQCRKLSVLSLKDDSLSSLRWDLNFLKECEGDGWFLIEGIETLTKELVTPLIQQNKGTLVIWQDMDRIIEGSSNESDFLNLIDIVEMQLSMVFHRFIQSNDIKIFINNKKLKHWDPFMEGHISKAWSSPELSYSQNSNIKAQCHVLPHKDKLTLAEYENAQGIEGWTAQQGFYVYRNKRLLLAGSWLGLGRGRSWTKDEAHKLARIRVDLPNDLDSDWKIDIRKSTARPPAYIKSWLVRLAEETRNKARSAFAYRGTPKLIKNERVAMTWKIEKSSSGMKYKIDLEHPAIQNVVESSGSFLPQLKAMFRVIEETVPVQKIWLDTAENKETPRTNFEGDALKEVEDILRIMFENMTIRKGMSKVFAKSQLLKTEPFHKYPELIERL